MRHYGHATADMEVIIIILIISCVFADYIQFGTGALLTAEIRFRGSSCGVRLQRNIST